ncbi:hypothetical protein ACI7RC_07865 [Brevibacillus sp. B_LB10_24]|uniref:hypothetical protein n=1 Tax=Brevibacillus sp. B_LB10_24 TaxID=3380645 RepID=UPI0038B99383
MQVLYKVLFVFCLLFLAAGAVYVFYYLPKVPSTPASVPQSMSSTVVLTHS